MKPLFLLTLLVIFHHIYSWCLKATISQALQIRQVDWSPDNTIFVSANKIQKVVRIYNAKTFELLDVHNNSGSEPTSVKISKDSKYIGIGYANKDIQLVHTTAPFATYMKLTGLHIPSEVDFSYDHALFMSCGDDSKFALYNIAAKTGPTSHNSNPIPRTGKTCKFSPLGIIAYADVNLKVKFFNTAGTALSDVSFPSNILQLDFIRNSNNYGSVSSDFLLRMPNSTLIYTDSAQLLTLSIGRAGKYYAFGGMSKKMFVYNQIDNTLAFFFDKFAGNLNSVRLSPDQNHIITGDTSGEIKIYTTKCQLSGCQSGEYNDSGVCKKCYTAKSNCVNCKTASTCDVCMPGYFVSGGSCSACFGSLNYCLHCQDANTCLKCLDGYYLDLDTKKCVKCALKGCIECNDSSTCTKCFRHDYYLNTTTNACVKCSDTLTNCVRCMDSATCVDCQLGFYEDATTKKCVQCSGNCLICQSDTNCSQCKVGYWASGGSCIQCTDTNCISCNQTGVCTDCKQGMYLTTTNTCQKCTNPCSTCSKAATNCTGCQIGYYLDVTNFQCLNCIENCKICKQSDKCLSCFPGFKLDSQICQPCTISFNNCSECTETSCRKCRQGFYLDTTDGNKCKSCISAIPNCLQCSSSTMCLQCVTSYFPTSGGSGVDSCTACPAGCSECISESNCTECFETFYKNNLLCSPCESNCFQCADGTNCRSCVAGFYLDSTTCQACTSVLSYCASCEDANTCSSCEPGAYLDAGECSLCADHCLTCDSTDCFSCEVGYFVDSTASPITCKQCNDSCQQCTSQLVCTSCISGYYIDSTDNKCKSCHILFPSCSQCNETNCFECEQGTVVNASTNNECYVCHDFIANCKSCYWDDTLATPDVKCQICNEGFGVAADLLSCEACNTIQGCIDCVSVDVCTRCEIGFYLHTDDTCQLCSQKCLTCEDGSSCLQCQQGYVNDGSDCVLCQSLIDGCSKCIPDTATTYNCTYCQTGYFLSTTDNQCYLCHQQMNGCYTCKDSSACTACLDKYYLQPSTGKCERCVTNNPGCQLCNSSLVCISCQNSYYLDTTTDKCKLCANNLPGCLNCLNENKCAQCQAGYYLHTDDTCLFCEAVSQGCIYCNSPTFCIQCRAGFYLDTTDNKCYQCTQPGCLACSQTDPNSCVSCSNKFFLDGPLCSDCVNLVPYCYQCNNTECLQCEVGYYLKTPLTCTQCSATMNGCSRCNDGFTCLQCMSSYFVNGSNVCQQCNQVLFGCQNCMNGSVCISCSANFFLNSTTDKCQSCTDLTGCMLCKNESTCVLCQQKYYMDGDQCKLCSLQIKGCFSCVSSTVCVQCVSGYVLDTVSYQCIINTIQAKQKVKGLKLVSYYVSSGILKHILYAKEILFKFIPTLNITDGGKTKLLIEDYTGKEVQLTITSYQFPSNGYSIIFYTDNPLGSDINLKQRKMSFRRLLLQQQINLQVLLKMDQNIYQQILPDLDYSGSMTVGYSLNDPQFTKSYMQVEGGKAYFVYEIIGLVFIVLFLINYIVKFFCTLPNSRNRHILLPHIIGLKACCLIVYPSHFEYMSFCKGFMMVDIHWLNDVIAQQLTDLSDTVVTPFGLFFDNMSIAGTYLLGLGVYIFLLLTVQCWYYLVSNSQQKRKSQGSSNQQSQLSSSQERRRQQQFKIQKIQQVIGVNYDNDQSQTNTILLTKKNLLQLLWNIFSFSVIYYSSLSVQGAFYNYQQIITINGVFYILGMLLFIYITIETLYSFIRNHKLINKMRIYVKAVLLSIAYLNPIYVSSICVAFDIMLIIIHFYLINNKTQLSKFFTITHILSTITILFMIFISHSLISLFLTVLSLLVCLGLQIYIHYKQYQIAHQTLNDGNEFAADQVQEHPQNQPQQFNKTTNNVWDLPLQKTKIISPNTNEIILETKPKSKQKTLYATMEAFFNTNLQEKVDNQPNPFDIEQVQLPIARLKSQKEKQHSRPSTSIKQLGRRNKLRKTQQVFKSNVIQIIPSRKDTQLIPSRNDSDNKIKTIFDFDQGENELYQQKNKQ